MDRIEERLRRDAAAIDARAPAEAVARAQARVRDTERRGRPQSRPHAAPWWLVGLASAGVAAAVLIAMRPATLPRDTTTAVPATAATPRLAIPADFAPLPIMQLDTVARTAPLDAELERLQSDLERARTTIQDDIRTMF